MRKLKMCLAALVLLASNLVMVNLAAAAQASIVLPTTGVHSGLDIVNRTNSALAATASMQSGAADPGALGAYTSWADTGSGLLKQRNAANSGWVTLGPLLTRFADLSGAGATVPTSQLPAGSTSAPGILQLTDSTGSASTTTAATPASVRLAYIAASNALAAIPAAGTAGNVMTSTGSGWSSVAPASRPLTRAAQQAASGSITFSAIPSWAQRVTIVFDNVSTTGSGNILVRIGSSSGGIESAGYYSSSNSGDSVVSGSSSSSGYVIAGSNWSGSSFFYGSMTLLNMSGNTWSSTVVGSGSFVAGGGSKTLSSTLDRVQVTASTGGLDQGNITVFYE